MPIAGPILGSLILAQMSSHGILGQSSPQLAMALGNGIINNVLATGVYTGVSTGLGIGAGASTGTITGAATIGPTVTGLIMTNALAMGLVGQSTFQLVDSVGQAFAAHMLTALVIGASTIVGIGKGTGIIVGIVPPVMSASIYSMMLSAGMVGVSSIQLANAIGAGIAIAMTMSLVNTVITGAAIGPVPPTFIPIPSVGTDIGKII
jgi:hypothetical protein